MEKKNQTISTIVNTGQCVSCGLCSAVCPKSCIVLSQKEGTYLPQIDEEQCIKCGLCNHICPGNQFDYNREYQCSFEPENFWVGAYRKILSMQSKDQTILKNATSGGVVTQLVKSLLDSGDYDCAFLVDTYNYGQQVHTKKFEKSDDLLKSTKSRYIPAAQNEAIAYALKNRDKRIIFVGTSCFVHGLLNVLRKFSLNRDNYLILGLFCDRTMNYKIYDYFNQHPKCNGKLDQLLFRTKEAGGWPGNMRLTFQDKGFIDLKSSERMEVKDYFQLERCLYCLDKLNQFADISIGDDYATAKSDKSGRSAVIIRTEKGEQLIDRLADDFDSFAITEKAIEQSQKLSLRKKNLNYISQKKLSPKIPEKVIRDVDSLDNDAVAEYKSRLAKIKMGKNASYKQIKANIPIKKKIFYLIINFMHVIPFLWIFKSMLRKIKTLLS